MTGVLPDDIFSNIPYEKGSNFMYYLEGIIGKEIMKEFLQNYFVHFKYQSVDFYQFQDYFIYFCNKSGVDEDSLNSIKWNEWIFEPGDCPVPNNFSNKYNNELQIVLDKFINENFTYLKENFYKYDYYCKNCIFPNFRRKKYISNR
jgi:leukotriene-A4 hydrolase